MASRRVPRTVGLQAVFQSPRNPAMEWWVAAMPLVPLVFLISVVPGINNGRVVACLEVCFFLCNALENNSGTYIRSTMT